MKNISMALLVPVVALAIWAGCETSKSDVSTLPALPAASLKPGPNDPRIAYVAARLLEDYHYSQRPLDEELSGKFFDSYIDSLDPRHENFLESDLAEFEIYRTNLDKLTLEHGTADLTPAFAIYDRYTERIEQHDAYAMELLKQDKFKFNTDETISLDRRHAPYPKDLAAAEALWQQQLRYEYLQEKLSREISETNGFAVGKLPADAATNITTTLARHYQWNLRMTTNWGSDGVLQAYLNGLTHAYDPHSDYLSAPHAQDFSIGMNLSLFGIGASLGEDDGYCTIRSLVPGGPAARSREFNEKDRIVAVAQSNQPPVDVVDMDLEKVVQLIRGPKGTEVRLTLSPAPDHNTRKVVTLIRDEIKLEDSEAKAKLVIYPDGRRIGIVDLPSFYAPMSGSADSAGSSYCSQDVAKLITKLKAEEVSGIIVDLRSNPGGSLEEAIKFTGLFIKGGPVVLVRNGDGQIQVDTDTDPTQLYDGPLVVMINRFSASASEIAAAALQDYGRALIVGDTFTHGKGTVQSINPLRPFVWPAEADATNDPGELKITIRKFYRVSGASTQLKGVASDIVLPDVLNDDKDIGEAALDNPLPWDTIPLEAYNKLNLVYDKLNLVQPYLATLKARSEERVATNQDFLYVQRDIAQFLKLQAGETAPINEREALNEREHIFLDNQARDAERAARKPAGMKIYEITLENAGQPGVVESKTNDAMTATTAGSTNAAGTNVLTQMPGTTTSDVNSATAEKQSTRDAMLDESERILLDYILLLDKNRPLIVNQ